ncbi:hypothetical protein [Cellulosimicrobium cellulans]|uniref:hypothetical protein n=1 Tax=Cellulosimicrobium cellulans TaxID=1710 RepID=UPI000848AAA0|nr:hypothetical protein [Cellulosimicrobium cellulans]
MDPRKTACLVGGLLVVLVLTACGGTSSRNGEWAVSGDIDRSRSTVPIRIEYGPACEDLEGIDVEEDSERVKITVRLSAREPEESAACSDVGVSEEVHVALDQPLGDRVLTGPELLDSSSLP